MPEADGWALVIKDNYFVQIRPPKGSFSFLKNTKVYFPS